VCIIDRAMSPPNRVQISPHLFQNTYAILGAPSKTHIKAVVK